MTTYKSYVERFNKNRSTKRDSSLDGKLTSEKETYTQFLEVQLDRISHSLIQLDTFNERLENASLQIVDIEDKVNNSNKLVKLLQSFAESQEEDNSQTANKLNNLQEKFDHIGNRFEKYVLLYFISEKVGSI